MSVFPDWEQYVVPQKREQTGCIPTGFEMLLRATHIDCINFDTFQDDFDLHHQGIGENNFDAVAAAVHKQYSHVEFEVEEFKAGTDKLSFVEGRLAQKQPILVSLAIVHNGKHKGWHIMPVVDADNDNLTLLWATEYFGRKRIEKIAKHEFTRIHDQYPGGKDVAYLKKPSK